MAARKPNSIRIVQFSAGYRVVRPGARYAVGDGGGEERAGTWLADDVALPANWTDTFTQGEARLLLPLLRSRGSAGRPCAEPTTPDGKLVARAQKRLGMTAAGLGWRIGAHASVLSRARNGELPEKHREAIRALLKGGTKGST